MNRYIGLCWWSRMFAGSVSIYVCTSLIQRLRTFEKRFCSGTLSPKP